MNDHIEQAAVRLEAAEAEVRDKLAALETESRGYKAELSRIHAALQALRGGKGKASKPKRSGVNAEDVQSYILQVWEDQGRDLPEADLKQEVQQRLKAHGRKLMGFGVTYPKALALACQSMSQLSPRPS